MEALLLVLDTLAMILLVYWSAGNDRRKPGSPISGLFLYRISDNPANGLARRRPARLPR
jgi:hypothetical protein